MFVDKKGMHTTPTFGLEGRTLVFDRRIDPKSVGEDLKRRGASPDILRQRGSVPPDGA